MLPVVKGPLVTTRAIRRYGWATIILSFLGIWALPEGGALYGLLILPFNGRLLQMVERLAAEPSNRDRAKGLFRWSILYLFGICLLLVMSRMSGSAQFDLQVRSVFDILASGFLPVTS